MIRKAEEEEIKAGKRDDLATTRRLSGKFVDQLLRYPFPGNVRELETILAAALAESPRGHIAAPESIKLDAPAPVSAPRESERAPVSEPQGKKKAPSPSKERVVEVLEKTGGNVIVAAEILGLSSRHALYRLMQKYGLRGPDDESFT
jgi:transcriptional regulator of acetoin/glycerol metabolism